MSAGTHKPAEAVHQIDEPQADALLELAAYRFTVENREARIAELEKENSYLNNACAEMEAQLEAIGAGGVEPLRKGLVRLTDVLARLEQGFGANSAPVTTIKRHFEMQATTVRDERAAFEAWLGIKPCGAAHDFGWAAWQARAALAATQPAAHGMEQDAARYQALVESGDFAPSHFDNCMWCLRAGGAPSTKAELDAAVDRVIAAQAKHGEQQCTSARES